MSKKTLAKYASVTTASFMVLQLGACSSMEDQVKEVIAEQRELDLQNSAQDENAVYEVPDDMTKEEYAEALMKTENIGVQDSDLANACDEWKEKEDGSFECLDEDSEYYAQHFFNGFLYATAGAMIGSAIYRQTNLKDGERKKQITNSAVVSPTNTRYTKANFNSTNGNLNKNSNTSKVDLNKSTTTGTKSSTGTNSTSSGSSSSKPNNSYSSGKTGFSSGGASRGGSSSS